MEIFRNCLPLFFIISFTSALTKMRKETFAYEVLVTNPTVPESGIQLLEKNGCKVIVVNKEDIEEIESKAKGVNALWWASYLPLDSKILEAAGPQMQTVGVMSAGYNHIDVDELKKRGIKVGNTPRVLDDAVADLTILLMLATARRYRECRIAMENNKWGTNNNWKWMLGQDISNSTIGIVGLGNIGQTVAKRLKGFDVKEILYTGHKEKPEGIELRAKFVPLKTLLEESDFVVVAVPLTKETKGMCNESFFASMKKTGIFINISRGSVVDQVALIDALKKGTILAAGLDVMTPEPLPSDHELMKLPNVVLTPHIGSATNDTRYAMSTLTAQNILRGLAGEPMFTPIY